MRRGVILDRDGTIVDFYRDADLGVVTPAFHPDQLRLLPGAVEGLRRLASAGFVLAIATNQPGAAKGEIRRDAIERTNAALVARLAAEGVTIASLEACLHHPTGAEGGDRSLVGPCDCRKPRPGMLRALVASLGLDPGASWAIGDTPTDAQAARAAGLRSALVVRAGRCELCPLRDEPALGARPDLWGASLDEIARAILGVAGAPV